jgi:hypothetical protein
MLEAAAPSQLCSDKPTQKIVMPGRADQRWSQHAPKGDHKGGSTPGGEAASIHSGRHSE